jgi:hypothetical protein
MLCGISVVFNSLGDVLGLMSCKRSTKNGQVLVGFQSTEAFGCLHHAGGGPAQRHRGISPSLAMATIVQAAKRSQEPQMAAGVAMRAPGQLVGHAVLRGYWHTHKDDASHPVLYSNPTTLLSNVYGKKSE